MSQIIWRPTQPGDIESVRGRAQSAQIGQLDQDAPRDPGMLEKTFRTFCLDGWAEAVFGVYFIHRGLGRGVGLLTEVALIAKPVALSRCVRRGIEESFAVMGLRRLEITCDARHEAAIQWAFDLGFHPEGKMKCYGPDGADHWLMAQIRGNP